MTPVTSLQNPAIKLIRSLSEKKFRRETGLFVAEGWDMLDRARTLGWAPGHLISTEPISPWGQTLPMLVSKKIMAAMSGLNNPHSALATFKQRYVSDVTHSGVWVGLENIRDPGNLGTIIRTADAAGASGVILAGNCCDPYSPDCIRATTGSIFAVPLIEMETLSLVELCKAWTGESVGTRMEATVDFRRTYRSPILLLMGSEGTGLSDELAEGCNSLVRVPMRNGAESLNVATATALMLYEINKLILK